MNQLLVRFQNYHEHQPTNEFLGSGHKFYDSKYFAVNKAC